MTRMILRIVYLSVAIICFSVEYVSSASDVTSGIRSKSKELRQLEESYVPNKKKTHKVKPSSESSGSSSSSGGSSGGSGGSGSSGGSGGGDRSGTSSSVVNGPSAGGKGGLLVGAGVFVAIAASLAYARPKEQITVSHPLNGAIAKRVSRFEALAGKASPGLRPDVSNDGNQYNVMDDGATRIV